mmetsp:Transcript_21577/g.59980  ORF Transcript_21577/g.59980 Transcript_21577/m.59980 type:complete len:126 (+) Transcript_21577:605-982(+)
MSSQTCPVRKQKDTPSGRENTLRVRLRHGPEGFPPLLFPAKHSFEQEAMLCPKQASRCFRSQETSGHDQRGVYPCDNQSRRAYYSLIPNIAATVCLFAITDPVIHPNNTHAHTQCTNATNKVVSW